MHEDMASGLQPVLIKWTMGGAAAAIAPEGLREKLGDDPEEAELRLLTIAGQALGMLVIPEPAGALQGLPDVPTLALPTLPDRLRPLTARILSRRDDWPRIGLLRLLETRGYVVHPSDWMPEGSGQVPDAYAPWQDWLQGVSGQAERSEERWEDMGPAGRLAMLKRLRRTMPDTALSIITEKFAGETAERRLAMVQTLAVRLGDSDVAFLSTLSKDRAPSVRAAAERLLSRLGGTSVTRDKADVTDLIRIEQRGILRRQATLVVASNMNHAQRSRLNAALETTDAATLAETLGVADVDLPGLWPWGSDTMVDQWFAGMLCATGSDAVMTAIDAAVLAGSKMDLATVLDGAARLSGDAVERLTAKSYATNRLINTATMAPTLGLVDDPDTSHEWRSLLLQLHRPEEVNASTGSTELESLGLLLTAQAARRVLDKLSATSIPSTDPRLDMLRLNAAL